MDRRLPRPMNPSGHPPSTHPPSSSGLPPPNVDGPGGYYYSGYPPTGAPPRYQSNFRGRPPPLPVPVSRQPTQFHTQAAGIPTHLHHVQPYSYSYPNSHSHSYSQQSYSQHSHPQQSYSQHSYSQPSHPQPPISSITKRKRTPTPPRQLKRVKPTTQPSPSLSEEDDDEYEDEDEDEDEDTDEDEDGFDAEVIPASDCDSDDERSPAQRQMEKARELAARLILADPETLMLKSDEREDSIAGTRLHFLKVATSRLRIRR